MHSEAIPKIATAPWMNLPSGMGQLKYPDLRLRTLKAGQWIALTIPNSESTMQNHSRHIQKSADNHRID